MTRQPALRLPVSPGCPPCAWTYPFFPSSSSMPTLVRKRRSKLWGGSVGKAVPWEGKRQMHAAGSWLQPRVEFEIPWGRGDCAFQHIPRRSWTLRPGTRKGPATLPPAFVLSFSRSRGPKGHGRLHSLMQHRFTKDHPVLALIHLCCSCPRILAPWPAFSGITEYNSFVPGTSMHACNAPHRRIMGLLCACYAVLETEPRQELHQ